MRKIRVICSDPYATDCSSDDDEESIEAKESTNGKQFVQEISVSIPTLHLASLAELTPDSGTFSVASDSSREDGPAKDVPICINQEIDGTISENNKNLERPKHPGLRMTASGKWGVQLSHPIEGTKMWFGSYNTFEEATLVCKKKKIEFAMLTDFINQKKPDMLRANSRRQRIVVDDMTVCQTVSGKWAAWTTDKVSKVKLWLGVYATPEEAMESYTKKFEFDSNCNPQGNNTAHDIASPNVAFRRPGIKLTKTGRWGVTIQHPSMERRYWLGSYDTPEEAAQVYDKKKIELEAETYFVHREKSARCTSTEVVNSQGLRVRYKGIRLRQSGRWAVEISDPRKKRRIHLGTFDTPEEAADVYNKKRLQFEARMARDKKRKLKHGADDDGVGAMIKTEPNNASPSLTLEAENSTVTAVGSQDSEGSNTNNDNQIPGSSLAAEDEFGFGVINSYGQFIGEYSSIDDELWII